mmetsp:Transcript_31478/g.58717  ORF Transcript_31478/g.58717 Transcript_31478/m.58717 type:complete len:242 (+) Transcript_31478:1006-1731(+)
MLAGFDAEQLRAAKGLQNRRSGEVDVDVRRDGGDLIREVTDQRLLRLIDRRHAHVTAARRTADLLRAPNRHVYVDANHRGEHAVFRGLLYVDEHLLLVFQVRVHVREEVGSLDVFFQTELRRLLAADNTDAVALPLSFFVVPTILFKTKLGQPSGEALCEMGTSAGSEPVDTFRERLLVEVLDGGEVDDGRGFVVENHHGKSVPLGQLRHDGAHGCLEHLELGLPSVRPPAIPFERKTHAS